MSSLHTREVRSTKYLVQARCWRVHVAEVAEVAEGLKFPEPLKAIRKGQAKRLQAIVVVVVLRAMRRSNGGWTAQAQHSLSPMPESLWLQESSAGNHEGY